MKLTSKMCDELWNELPLETKRYIICIVTELNSAIEKHPNWPADFVHAAAIVGEESGELLRAAIQYELEDGRYYDMHKEAIQTAATCLRFLCLAPEKQFPE